jgi:outer membrane receptor protein involved in Fe transport
MVWDKVKIFQQGEDHKELTPFVSASWQPFRTNDWRIRGFYKNIFRLPTFNDLYYTFIGNTTLRPEYVKQYDIGFTWTKQLNKTVQYVSLQADAYYNEVTDKIVAVPSTNLYRWMMLNLGKVDIRGLDLSGNATWRIGQQVLLQSGVRYTWQQAQDVTAGAFNDHQQIPYVPRHSGSALLNVLWRDYNLNYSFIYSGERYSQKANIPVNYLQPWYTQDLSVSGSWKYHKTAARLMLEVNNLFNQYYDVIINFPMPARYYRITCSISY